MKKEMKHYESPKMEVIEMDPTVILAGSGEDEGNEMKVIFLTSGMVVMFFNPL